MNELTTETTFQPTPAQARAKARFQQKAQLNEGLRELETLTLEELCAWAGTTHVKRWAKDPRFLPYLLDKDTFDTQTLAMRDLAMGRLEEILTMPFDLEGRTYLPKDALKAIETVMNLTGSFPSRQKEIHYLDRDVARLDEEGTAAELKRLKQKKAELTDGE